MTLDRLDDSTLIRERASALTQRAASLVSRQIRSIGAIGGNLITGSPATDMLRPLPRLNASVLNMRTTVQRRWR